MLYKKDINTAAETVFKGGVVIIPTDTIFGFSCDPRNETAVTGIRTLKQRDKKPFIILDSSPERVKDRYFCSNSFISEIIELMISENIWPGSVTLIADKNPELKLGFLSGYDKIAVRFTTNEVIRSICDKIGYGIISTSINVSGEPEINDINRIKTDWCGKVDYILDISTHGTTASTIIELFTDEKKLRFLRVKDMITRDKLEKIISNRYELCP